MTDGIFKFVMCTFRLIKLRSFLVVLSPSVEKGCLLPKGLFVHVQSRGGVPQVGLAVINHPQLTNT